MSGGFLSEKLFARQGEDMHTTTTINPFNLLRFFVADTPTGGDTTSTDATSTTEATETEAKADAEAAGSGYPENTPIKDMTDREQAAYWKHMSRKHENQWKTLSSENDVLREKAQRWDEQVEAGKSDAEKAVEQAREEGRQAARAEMAESMARTEVAAALKLRNLPDDTVEAIVSPLNFNEFLTKDFEVDAGKVSAYADQFNARQLNAPRQPATGQGTTTPNTRRRGVQSGRDLYASRHNKNNK